MLTHITLCLLALKSVDLIQVLSGCQAINASMTQYLSIYQSIYHLSINMCICIHRQVYLYILIEESQSFG
jgi:hypothetical protein